MNDKKGGDSIKNHSKSFAMAQADYGGSRSTNRKDIEAEVNAAFDATIRKSRCNPVTRNFAPVSVETVDRPTASRREPQPTAQVTKPSLSKTETASTWEQSRRTLDHKGINQTTLDFGGWNPAPVLRDHFQRIPATQKVEPVAQTFADVHKLASLGGNADGRSSGGSFGGRGGVGGGFSGGVTSQVDVPRLDFQYIDQNSVNALGLGPIPADKLRNMADAGQIWMYDPGETYKFVVMWAPGWNAERYKRYRGAGTPSSESMSADIIDRAMEQKQSGEDSQGLIGRMMAEDHGGTLSVEGYKTLPDFEYYAQIGANIQNPTYKEAEGYAYILGWRPGAEDVGNIVTFSRDNADMIVLDEIIANNTVGDIRYLYMTDDEVSVYNYLLAKEGEESAQKFLDCLEEELNKRYGTAYGEGIRNMENDVPRTLLTGATAAASGLDDFGQGVHQLFSKERLPTSAVHYSSEYVRDDLIEDGNGFGVVTYDTLETISNVAPSVLVSYLTTPVVGAAVQGASAAGNAYNQALAEGYSTEQAATYGTLIGVSEGALQYLLGGISKLGGVSSEQLLTKLVGIENGLLRAAAALGIKGLSEVTEEELQLVLQPVYRSIVFGEDYDAPTIEEYVYTAVVSFAMLGVMEAGDIASYARNRPVQLEYKFDVASEPSVQANAEYDILNSKAQDLEQMLSFDSKHLAKNSTELLPNYQAARVPDEKLVGYALNKNHPSGKYKAVAFEQALGYTADNKDLLLLQVYQGLERYRAVERSQTEYGRPFEVAMMVLGANGRYAKVKTAWIIEKGKETPRLVSLYIDE